MLVDHGKGTETAVRNRGEQLTDNRREFIQRFYNDIFLVRRTTSRNSVVKSLPFPTTQSLMRLAQYSLLHHSTNLRRVSRPTTPPSASDSLPEPEPLEGVGEGTLDGIGVTAKLPSADFNSVPLIPLTPFTRLVPLTVPLSPFDALTPVLNAPLAFKSLPTLDKLSLLPLPNLLHGCPGLLRYLLIWNILHLSFWWFFLCSESTALSSREVQEGAKSGEWKNAAKRERAPGRAAVATEKK